MGILIEMRCLFEMWGAYLETTMVSVLHKELEYRVEKLKYQMSEVIQLRIKNKSEPPVSE